jgi:hypothetical protein
MVAVTPIETRFSEPGDYEPGNAPRDSAGRALLWVAISVPDRMVVHSVYEAGTDRISALRDAVSRVDASRGLYFTIGFSSWPGIDDTVDGWISPWDAPTGPRIA